MAGIARDLRRTVNRFLEDYGRSKQPLPVPFSEIENHVNNNGFRTADRQMFKEWMQAHFPNAKIHYKK